MWQMGSKLQGLRDKHRDREGQIKKLRSRDTALQQAMRTCLTVLDVQKGMQDFQGEITCLENTNEGRRASDAGSVHRGNAGASCFVVGQRGISEVFAYLWNGRAQLPPGALRS